MKDSRVRKTRSVGNLAARCENAKIRAIKSITRRYRETVELSVVIIAVNVCIVPRVRNHPFIREQ